MREFSLYCDLVCKPMELGNQLDFVQQMKKSITSKQHTFVVVPGGLAVCPLTWPLGCE
jgi:hypothetical protein